MRYAAFAIVLALIFLAHWATDQGWIALPDIVMRALMFGLPLTYIPLYVEGLRAGELAVPPRTIRRRDTPRLFWFVAVFNALLALVLVSYLGGEFVQGLMAL